MARSRNIASTIVGALVANQCRQKSGRPFGRPNNANTGLIGVCEANLLRDGFDITPYLNEPLCRIPILKFEAFKMLIIRNKG